MENNMENRHLFRLGELKDYEVTEGDPDVRGWIVIDKDNDKLGTIHELIVDPNKNIVRYLDVISSPDLSIAGGERHFIIPIGAAKIDEHEDRILVKDLDKDVLKNTPDYKGGAIARDYEFDVLERILKNKERKDFPKEDFYDQDIYNEASF